MELARIKPKRIEIRKGALYKNGNHFFEITEVDMSTREITGVYINTHLNSVVTYQPQAFIDAMEGLRLVLVGDVVYKKRWLRKPKRIVKYFK